MLSFSCSFRIEDKGIDEHQDLEKQHEATTLRADSAQAENKKSIDRWMLEKMKDAEHLNEANAENMLGLNGSSIQQIANQQVDGLVRRSEEGAEYYVQSTITTCKQRMPDNEGGCASILFEHNSNKLVSGGQDRSIKIWATSTGSLNRTLHGCLVSVLDVCITHDNKSVFVASSSNNLYGTYVLAK